MFVYYNVIWIICMVFFFVTLFMYFNKKRRRARNNLVNGNYATDPNFVIVDMNGRQSHRPTQPATYDPPPPTIPVNNVSTYRPSTSDVEPPPPSYQDYSKDHRVQNS
ncbi:hypothetical protein INT48_002366 [Thamnidium elegans]|uniref:Uncharacterized protein n=1 Tax=Thamnidium elegans TaxID=101142 RepID=A0A8H7SUQ2_9FUNG|nr:hypothetical protein INT48_002366 [Thamnidium elegans]